MSKSQLQDPFLREFADNFIAVQRNLTRRLAENGIDSPIVADLIREQLRGLYHGLLVMFDGGTKLADEGLVRIVDEDGEPFDRNLHEICFSYWPK